MKKYIHIALLPYTILLLANRNKKTMVKKWKMLIKNKNELKLNSQRLYWNITRSDNKRNSWQYPYICLCLKLKTESYLVSNVWANIHPSFSSVQPKYTNRSLFTERKRHRRCIADLTSTFQIHHTTKIQ